MPTKLVRGSNNLAKIGIRPITSKILIIITIGTITLKRTIKIFLDSINISKKEFLILFMFTFQDAKYINL